MSFLKMSIIFWKWNWTTWTSKCPTWCYL